MSQQPKEVMALRARLLRHGYTDISIRLVDNQNLYPGMYCIRVIEPLAKQRIIFYSSLACMSDHVRCLKKSKK